MMGGNTKDSVANDEIEKVLEAAQANKRKSKRRKAAAMSDPQLVSEDGDKDNGVPTQEAEEETRRETLKKICLPLAVMTTSITQGGFSGEFPPFRLAPAPGATEVPIPVTAPGEGGLDDSEQVAAREQQDAESGGVEAAVQQDAESGGGEAAVTEVGVTDEQEKGSSSDPALPMPTAEAVDSMFQVEEFRLFHTPKATTTVDNPDTIPIKMNDGYHLSPQGGKSPY